MRAETLAGAASVRRACVVGAALLALLAGAVQADNAITGIDVVNKADRVVISVQGNCALKMTTLKSTRGDYLGFQFPFKLVAKGGLVGIRSGRIYNVRFSNFQPNPPTTRIVVNTTAHLDYSTQWSSDKRRVEIHVLKHGVKPQQEPEVKVKASGEEVGTPALSAAAGVAVPVAVDCANVKTCAPRPAEPDSPSLGTKPVMLASTELIGIAARPVADRPAAAVVAKAPEQATARPAAQPAAAEKATVARLDTAPARADKRVALNFLAADIHDVLKALSVQSGHNVVAGKDVTGNITVSLSNVSVDEALDYVAKLSGYGYVEDNGTYLVASRESLGALTGAGAQDSVTELLKLSYAKADDVIALVKTRFPDVQTSVIGVEGAGRGGLSSKGGDTGIASRNNLLVLMGPGGSVDAAKSLIGQFENTLKVQAVESTTAVYHVKYVNARELATTLATLVPGIGITFAPTEGFDLAGPRGISVDAVGSVVQQDDPSKTQKETDSGQMTRDMAGLAGGAGSESAARSRMVTAESGSRPQAIIIVGRQVDIDKALQLAQQFDVKSPQIKIDAKITSINRSGEKKLGLTWEWNKITFLETAKNAWSRQPFNFAGALSALIENGDAQLLASPTLVCLEGKPGVFFVGDDVTYIIRVETTPTGQNVITETKQVGVQLRVVGDVSPDGYVTLNLHPEVSVLKLTQDATANINLPIVTRRFTDHVVRVKDGETIVIGGLIRNDEIEEMTRVPVLGSVPLLGHLFRHKQVSRDHTEVVMFITASVLAD